MVGVTGLERVCESVAVPLRYDQLPDSVRQRLREQGHVRTSRSPVTGGGKRDEGVFYRCVACDHRILWTSKATPVAAARHSDATGHSRWAMILASEPLLG